MIHPNHAEIDPHDLPTWMRRARRGIDWGIACVFALSLLAAWPFVLQPGLPRANASENYVFLAADYSAALREGRLYPRWSAHALNGYGAPIPNFYPPGAPYAAALVDVLFTNNTLTAVRLVYIAAICLAGTMTYCFILRRAGAAAGVLASVLFVLSPYFAQTAPHILGDLPGVIALALLPTLLWAVDRQMTASSSGSFLITSLTGAALILTDPRSSCIGFGLALAVALHHRVVLRCSARRLALVITAGICSLLLASFYWLPAVAESQFVDWRAGEIALAQFRIEPLSLISPLRRIDLAEQVPRPQLTLGIGGILFTLAGACAIMRFRKAASLEAIYLLAGLGMAAAAALAAPYEIGLLGPISFCFAVSGSAVSRLNPQRYAHAFLPLLVIAAVSAAFPAWLAPRWPKEFGSITPTAQLNYEQRGYGIAVLPPGSRVPATISESLGPNRFLLFSYQSGVINRIQVDQIGARRQVDVLSTGTHEDRYQIRVAQPTEITVTRGYFPGWQARVDGLPVALGANAQTGLIRVTLPQIINGTLEIRLGATAVRRAAWQISWATLAGIVLGTLNNARRRRHPNYSDARLLSINEARLLSIIIAAFAGLIALFAAPFAPYSLNARPGHLLDNSLAVQSRTETGMELISYRLERSRLRLDDTLELALAWRTARPLLDNYRVQIHLVDTQQGVRWQETGFTHPGALPTRRWLTNAYISDFHWIPLADSLVPGEYRIGIEIFGCNPDCLPQNRLTFFDPNGERIGQALILPTRILVSQ